MDSFNKKYVSKKSLDQATFWIITNPYRKLIHNINGTVTPCSIVNCVNCINREAIKYRYLFGVLDERPEIKCLEVGVSMFTSIKKARFSATTDPTAMIRIKIGPQLQCVVLEIASENIFKKKFGIPDDTIKELNEQLTIMTIPPGHSITLPSIASIPVPSLPAPNPSPVIAKVQCESGGICRKCGCIDDYAEQGPDGKVTCWRCYK